MSNEQEEWRPVTGFKGSYEVSSAGRLRSVDRVDSRGHRRKGALMKPALTGRDDRFTAILHRDGKRFRAYVSRLVAIEFIPNPENHPFVLHWNDNPRDNRVENLHWGTHEQNMQEMVDRSRHVSVNALKTHCKRGHPYDQENTKKHGNSRDCRTCVNDSQRRKYREKNPNYNYDPKPAQKAEIEKFCKDTRRLPRQATERNLYQRLYRAMKRGEEWAVTLWTDQSLRNEP